MARATSPYQASEYGQPGAGEWQELRGELVALLDQVETQVARTTRQEPGYHGLAERMRDLRHQVVEAEPDNRHREALRSVQKAIEKFSDRDEPMHHANPRDTLESAIHQIRSRHFPAAAPQPQPQPERYDSPRFDEMAQAVGGITTRLERLEAELKTQARGQTANVKEIADQVGQLSHVVELLAGAVGETGQVKRLEGHIAGLAKLIAEGPKVDLSALNKRLDDVSMTVGKLAELQKLYADRSDATGLNTRLDDVSATVGRLADLQVQFANKVDAPPKGLKAIEDGVRNIYDRVDSIERTMSVPQAELETITEQLGQLTLAMRQQPPQGLIELIDALNDRISNMESRSSEVGGLKLDMEELRYAVAELIEPRFNALEQQLGAISDRLDERPAADPGIAQLESQVRQLVARMDQTGEQLTGLAELYRPAEPLPLPDFEQLADHVARKTSAAMQQLDVPPATMDEAAFDEIEKRLGRLLEAAEERPSAASVALEATIREVNERLERIEGALQRQPEPAVPMGFAAMPPVTAPAEPRTAYMPPKAAPKPEPEPAPAFEDSPIAPLFDALSFDDEPAPRPVRLEREDLMPSDPSAEAPLVDRPFSDPNPLRTALEAKNGPRLRTPAAEDATPVRPAFNPELAERPPQPRSSFELPEPEPFAPMPEPEIAPVAIAAEEPQAPNRNTFIAAHRRAARQAAVTGGKVPELPTSTGGNSLISRAFARFQASRTEKAAAAEPQPMPEPTLEEAVAVISPPPAEKPAAKEKKKKGRLLAGSKAPASKWTPDEPEAPVLPPAPEPSVLPLGADEAMPVDEAEPPKRKSFLLRHRQPILLAASIVAIACLTFNLINQRQAQQQSQPETPAARSVGDASMSSTPLSKQNIEIKSDAVGGPRVIPMADEMTTGSVGGGPAQGFVPDLNVPKMPEAFEAATGVTNSDPAQVASLSDAVEPLASPVRVEMPPENVGPAPLRAGAADGDVRAQFEIAAIYTEGRAVPEDLNAAAKWYERAAGQGFAPAQYRLGTLYENGRGVAKDLAQARLWYQQAAEAGNRMAMHNLAALYAGGGLGTQQFDAAAKWFEEAANRGMKDSQFNLGMLYARGLGVKQDLPASYRWFSLAAAKGDADAAKARDDVAASLDAATVQKLNDEVSAFKPVGIDFAANFAPIGTWSKDFDPGTPIANTKVVMGVQNALTLLGFDVGTPDGVAGPKTQDAIRNFERATGMSESGTINPRLLAVLGSQPV